MQSFKYVVTDELGIHARPAGFIVKEAKKFSSDIKLVKGEKSANCTQLFGMMGLGVKQNDEVEVVVTGEDEMAACEAIKQLFESNL